jgi:hypothetical protein
VYTAEAGNTVTVIFLVPIGAVSVSACDTCALSVAGCAAGCLVVADRVVGVRVVWLGAGELTCPDTFPKDRLRAPPSALLPAFAPAETPLFSIAPSATP